jgi:hypothetical protein
MSEPDVNFQLGQLGVSWDRVVKMKSDLREQTSLMRAMGAEAKTDIIADNARGTGKRLCYTCGIDGCDSRYWIEDIPAVHVDWEMTEKEWEELRATLWWSTGAYARRLQKEGKLGKLSPGPRPSGLSIGGNGGSSAVFAGNVVVGGGGGGGVSVGGSASGDGGGGDFAGFRGWGADAAHAVQKPVDSAEDTWKCQGCGQVYVVEHGFAICPNDPGLKRKPIA